MPGSQIFGQFLNVKSVQQADPGECRTLFSACFQAQCVLSGESSTCKERMDWTQAQHSSCAPAQISIVYRSLTANSCFVFLLQEHVFGSHENACNLAYSKVQALDGTEWHWMALVVLVVVPTWELIWSRGTSGGMRRLPRLLH